jgi:hypothetical protein
MTHKHHIIPKYKGGTDDPFNLVEVTVTQHAMFHYCNWRLWGEKYDWLAWRGLTGEIGKEEIILQARLEGSRRGLQKAHTMGSTPARKKHAQKIQPLAMQAALTPESRAKRINSFKAIGHQRGQSNSQYGTMWVTNGETNKKIKKNEPIPEGYSPGRKLK